MGIYTIFKPKKKSVEVAESPFMTELREKETRFSHISKDDFAKLDDDELLDAMLYWVDHLRWKEDVNLEELPEPVQNAYACFSVYGEIMNGGLNQVFFNDTKYYVHLCVFGYEKIGAEAISPIIKEAFHIVTSQKEHYEALDDGTLDSFLESYKDDPLEHLDDEFYRISDVIDLSQIITNYIRLNINSFGN
jgi:hypothetical protein